MRWLILMLVLLLAGCTPTDRPASPEPRTIYLEAGSGSYLSLDLPEGWSESSARGERVFVHKKQGRLVIHDLGSNLRKSWLDQLHKAQSCLPDRLAEARDLIQAPFALDREPDWDRLRPLMAPLSDPVQTPKKFQHDLDKLVEYLQSSLPPEDLTGRVQDYYLHHGYALRSQQSLSEHGQKLTLVEFGTRAQFGHGLYALVHDHLIGLELYSSARERATAPAFLSQLAHTLALDVALPPGAEATGPTPTPQVAQTRPIRHSRRRTRGEPGTFAAILKWLGPWLPTVLLMIFIGAPAYLGARGGYAAAEARGADPRRGAAGGAFTATFFAIVTCGSIVVALAWYWALQAPRGSGVMTPVAASMFLTILMLIFGIVASALAASLAALGAYLGSGMGGRSGAALAALLAILGLLATPLVFQNMPIRSKRRRSAAPIPIHYAIENRTAVTNC